MLFALDDRGISLPDVRALEALATPSGQGLSPWLWAVGAAFGLGLMAFAWRHRQPEQPRFGVFLAGTLVSMFCLVALGLTVWG